ncbi:DUF1992 domain-containing protein [Microbacterium sp. Marseille-Q6648]|uniref:DnaJ family domain-containing protein n=1 Tax=Microbacterium sp. Marseille-Q6648 TaxID=2937991 RepID=UPI00203AAF6A|nr:DUF1992 domain-containing protein [Microbacterium sp. Marseille-Q6648]
MTEDPRLSAARYRMERLAEEEGAAGEGPAEPAETAETRADAASRGGPASDASDDPARRPTSAERAAYVETVIQQAIRRGDFDDLPGAGKPIPGLGRGHDPDWWIRRKIESEKLTGLGPPALTLRVEDAELDARLDELPGEDDVREAVDDFNRRVKLARMQLLGGPPVVTPLRDVEAEVQGWAERRAARARSAASAAAHDEPRRRWWRRR